MHKEASQRVDKWNSYRFSLDDKLKEILMTVDQRAEITFILDELENVFNEVNKTGDESSI